MSRFSKSQLKLLATARKRPVSIKLGQLSDELIHQLISYYRLHSHENILQNSIDGRSQRNVPMENSTYLNANYGQVALQGLKQHGVATNRVDYLEPLVPDLINEVQAVTGTGYRMRISALDAGAEIPEHVDDPEQIRALALISGKQIFHLRTKSEKIEIDMQPGEIWYINTAWPHQVFNTGTQTRLALLIDLAQHDFENKIAEISA